MGLQGLSFFRMGSNVSGSDRFLLCLLFWTGFNAGLMQSGYMGGVECTLKYRVLWDSWGVSVVYILH